MTNRDRSYVAVNPKKLRSIALYAVSQATNPVVLANKKQTDDFSETGLITKKHMRNFIDFEIRNGDRPMLGYHDHPDQMWIEEELAKHCQNQSWLRIEWSAGKLTEPEITREQTANVNYVIYWFVGPILLALLLLGAFSWLL